jgi:hypothetical protein
VLRLSSVWESFVFVSRRGPLGQSGVERLESGWFSWATGCPSAFLSLAGRDGLVTRVVSWGVIPSLSAWTYAPYLQGYLTSSSHSPCLKDNTPGEGCLTEVRQGRPITLAGIMEWCAGATIITAREATSVDAFSRCVAGPTWEALSPLSESPVAYIHVA